MSYGNFFAVFLNLHFAERSNSTWKKNAQVLSKVMLLIKERKRMKGGEEWQDIRLLSAVNCVIIRLLPFKALMKNLIWRK